MDTVEILGIPFAKITQEEALNTLEIFLLREKNHVIVTPNPEGVMQAQRNPAFFDALTTADLSLADGTGILLASKFRNLGLPQRVRGVDTIFALLKRLNSKRDFTAYFLGGTPGTAENAKACMEEKYPRLTVVGFHHGFFSADDEILAEINAARPDILLVCTGMPRAEIWATTNRNVNAHLTMCLGGTLDLMAGNVTLAPAFLRKIGLEWLWRLIRQPQRFWRMMDIPRFVWRVVLKR